MFVWRPAEALVVLWSKQDSRWVTGVGWAEQRARWEGPRAEQLLTCSKFRPMLRFRAALHHNVCAHMYVHPPACVCVCKSHVACQESWVREKGGASEFRHVEQT